MTETPDCLWLDIYGYRAAIRSASAGALSGIAEDFAFFRSAPHAGGIQIELLPVEPPFGEVPSLVANVYTPRNVSYREGQRSYIDYSGRALAIHDRASGHFRVFSRDEDLLYEAAYLFLLSQCGEALDAAHLHRVHALGVSLRGCAALVLLPIGGGKSTLGAHLLEYPDIEFLSDDSPLIDARGSVHAFPLQLGLLPGSEGTVPPDQLRRINRMEFGPKLLVNYKYFEMRVRPEADPGLLFLGRRSLSAECTIARASHRAALRAMVENCVVGMGLFQGMEFVFQRGAKEIASKAAVAWSRLRASRRLIRRSDVLHLTLGRNPAANAAAVYAALSAAAGSSATRDRVENRTLARQGR